MSAAEVLSALDRIHGTVSVIGSMNADYTVTAQRLPGPGETITGGPLQLLPGGKSGNQAAAAARIGATVQMFGAVGSDRNADFLLGALGEAGVNTTHVRRVLGPSGTTVITVDAQGENTIVYSPGSNAQVTVDYVESVRDALTRSSVLGLCLESPIETVTAAARMCHEAGVKVLLMKPQTFMNLSGDAVRKAADFYKVPPERIIVLFDDISLAPGRLRIRKTGSAGGHNGIKSIDRSLGTSKYARVRMGVGHAQRGAHAHDNTVNWVLGGFGPDQRKQLPEFLADGADAAETIIFDGLAATQEKFNGR